MKAWNVSGQTDGFGTVVYADTAGKAKSKVCRDTELNYIDVRAKRIPSLDGKQTGCPKPKVKKGDKVRLFDCAEVELWPDVMFDCITDPWQLGHGTWVIKIKSPEKYYPSFECECLEKI